MSDLGVPAVPRPEADEAALAAKLRGGPIETIVILSVLVLAVAAGAWWLLQTPGASLEIEGEPIDNAQQVLDTAAPVFRAIADADGAVVVEGAGCWFAPPADVATTPGPRVACGPIALGIADDNQPWLVGDARYQRSNNYGYLGTFSGFTGVAEVDADVLRRPDGAAPPAVDLDPPSEGVRTESGRRVIDVAQALDAADRAFATVAAEEGGTTTRDSRCYLGVRETGGRRVAVGGMFCGPVRILGSALGDTWARFEAPPIDGELLVTATIGAGDIRQIDTTVTLPPGTTLYRPDGEKPATDGSTSDTPDASP